MNEIIAQTLRDFSLDDYRPIIARDLDLGDVLSPRAGNLVKVIVGMRRSGKSYRLFQEMDAVHKSGVPWSRICYFNFEDDRLYPVTSVTGDEVMHAFYSMHPEAIEEGAYFFFDELQEMDAWGAWLRRIVDTKKATIYVSGSSSQMLSSEISTEFRGRAIDFELLPCSFRESLRFGEYRELPDETGFFSLEDSVRLERAFASYLERGGFPSVQALPFPQSVLLLQSYVQRVVARDVIERHDVRRARVVSALSRRILESNARTVSVRKIENDFRSAGLSTSRELLGDLLSYFEQAYLVFQVRELSRSLSESSTAPPKVYAIDPGLALANSRASVNDEGQRLENAVYLELRRRSVGFRRDEISSMRTRTHGYEIDFVRGDAISSEAYELYQVSVSVEDERTRERELRALWEAMEEHGLDRSVLIVGRGDSATYEQNGMRIDQIPAWKWLLRDEG
ncbi:MAG: ATP-binding protein [Slackia sp.]|nr:ATP-binding protein [Slackia sp.]